MKPLYTLFTLFIITVAVHAQDITVNEKVDYNLSYMNFENSGQYTKFYCFDKKSNDTISFSISNGSLSVFTFTLKMSGNKILPEVSKGVDYPAYDGKSSINLEIKHYSLEINKMSFKPGDTLRCKFSVVTKSNKFVREEQKIEGEIFHILNGDFFVWEGDCYIQNKRYKNGKFLPAGTVITD